MNKQGSIIAASFWMILITGILFWLPVVGPLLGGIVGGKIAGEIGNALMAVFLPAILVGGFFSLFTTALTGLPLIGALAGIGGGILVLAQVGPLLLGAIIGSLIS